MQKDGESRPFVRLCQKHTGHFRYAKTVSWLDIEGRFGHNKR